MIDKNIIVKLECLARLIDEICSDGIELIIKLNTSKKLYSEIKRDFNIDPLQSCDRSSVEEGLNK